MLSCEGRIHGMFEAVDRRHSSTAGGERKIQMLPSLVQRFETFLVFSWIVLIGVLLLPVRAQGQQQQFSSNPDDYDFGWLTVGIHAPGSVPYCTYCVIALDNSAYASAADEATDGLYWNSTVGLYRCDGLQNNEMWAYEESTNSIVFSNLTTVLCIDALLWDSMGLLKLRTCNSSVVTQQWQMEGNQVISGRSDSSGQPLHMVGGTPNMGTNLNNQEDSYPLVVNSSIPSDGGGYSYTANFTFLSKQNFVDRSTNRITTKGLLQINNSSRDQIINGDFESSTIQAGTDITWSNWQQTEPSYFALCGWVIEYGPIDYVKSGFLQAANGSLYSVHLNTHSDVDHWGSISQTFRTEAGRAYVLSFCFNGFPPNLQIPSRTNWHCSIGYSEAHLQVGVTNATSTDMLSGAFSDGNGFTQNFTFDVTSSNSPNFGKLWKLQIVMFTASTSVTTISFSSLNFNDSCGPMIDEVKVSPLESGSQARSKILLVIAASIGGLAIVISVLGVVYGTRYCRRDKDYSGLYKTENTRVFSVKELSVATKKFSSVLGERALGTMYKADFPDGSTGAVKVEKSQGLNSSSTVRASDELTVLLRVHHRNLVNLIGFCIDKGRHMLVFEYLPNGSLYDRLHQSILHFPKAALMDSLEPQWSYSSVLSWKQRVKIAADVACGLDYLHNEADPPIVHRDVTTQNILLTATDSAKLADFGLSKATPVNATSLQSIETMVRGSIGYLDPQYLSTGIFSAKSDVYSFGVVLLELISGHPGVYNAAPLASWAAPYLTTPSLYHELVDKKLNGAFDANELESVVELSRMCIQEDSRMRPNMRQVVAFINNRKLATVSQGASEWIEESKAREAYHKMNPMFIDFESVPLDASSSNNFLPLVEPTAERQPPFENPSSLTT